MNTTPSTSKLPLTYSVLSPSQPSVGSVRGGERVTLILLNRDSWLFRSSTLEELSGAGFLEILSLEVPPFKADYQEILEHSPTVRFMHFSRKALPGELINLAVREARGEFCLTLWDDQAIIDAGMLARLFKTWDPESAFCAVPELLQKEGAPIPSLMVPSLYRKNLRFLPLSASDSATVQTVFPFDYTALFHRQSFLSTGGYDTSLSNPFWQKAEWGLRSCLWGERFEQISPFRIGYRGDMPLEDQTYDDSYRRTFLKTMAVRFSRDHGELSWTRFWNFWCQSGMGPGASLKEFRELHGWVKTHRYRFKTDLRALIELWGHKPGVIG